MSRGAGVPRATCISDGGYVLSISIGEQILKRGLCFHISSCGGVFVHGGSLQDVCFYLSFSEGQSTSIPDDQWAEAAHV